MLYMVHSAYIGSPVHKTFLVNSIFLSGCFKSVCDGLLDLRTLSSVLSLSKVQTITYIVILALSP